MDIEEQNIVCFDGVCGICNEWVDFLIKKDPSRRLRYCPLQNEKIHDVLRSQGIDPTKLETIVFLKKGKAYIKSDGALEILKTIKFQSWLVNAAFIFPKWLRNMVYELIARNRYHIMKPKDSCRVPSAEEKDLFL
tara:strand:- start:2883 stop:3287 length:405 start_codon:yes stop_codon:yes gene_type:complete